MHVWSYLKSSWTEEIQVGPISESEFISHIKQGQVKRTTKVVSQTRTKGKWYEAQQVTGLKKLFEQIDAQKKSQKLAALEEKQQKKLIAKQQKAILSESSIPAPSVTVPPPIHEQSPSTAQLVSAHTTNTQIVVAQPPSNAIGMAGFVMSLVSLLTCGILFPLSAVFSFIGVFYKPKGFAVAGLIISGVACMVLVLAWISFLGTMIMGVAGVSAAVSQVKIAAELTTAKNSVRSFYEANDRLPNQKEYASLFSSSEASMLEAIRFEKLSETSAMFTHFGNDEEFGTFDDSEIDAEFASAATDEPSVTGDSSNSPAISNDISDRKNENEEIANQAEENGPLALNETYTSAKLSITVVDAKITKPNLKSFGNDTKSEEDFLVVKLRVRNNDDRKQLVFRENQFRLKISAKDDVGNQIRRVGFGIAKTVGELSTGDTIDPEETKDHVLVFNIPLPKTEHILVNIDLSAFGGKDEVTVRLEASVWQDK